MTYNSIIFHMTYEDFKSKLKDLIVEFSVRYNEAEKELDFLGESHLEEIEYFDHDADSSDYEYNRLRDMDSEYEYAKETVKEAKENLEVLFNAFENVDSINYGLITEREIEQEPIFTLRKFGKSNSNTPFKHVRF